MVVVGLLVTATHLVGCADDPVPTATVRAATPDQLIPADDLLDDLTITIEYDDGDGDLGGGVAEIHDCRGDGLVTALTIPEIADTHTLADHKRIHGTLDLRVNDVGEVAAPALANTCRELSIAEPTAAAAVFCVIVVDAAGHRSAGDCTAAIAIAAP